MLDLLLHAAPKVREVYENDQSQLLPLDVESDSSTCPSMLDFVVKKRTAPLTDQQLFDSMTKLADESDSNCSSRPNSPVAKPESKKNSRTHEKVHLRFSTTTNSKISTSKVKTTSES